MFMQINTWDKACGLALKEIFDYAKTIRLEDPLGLTELDAVSHALAEFVRHPHDADIFQAAALMRHAAACALHIMHESSHILTQETMQPLLCRKQHDYGHGNIENFGLVGVAVRLCDKIARAKNLKKRGGNVVKNETIVDTYEDIVGYATIAIMLRDGTFSLDLDTDEAAKRKYITTESENTK
jgi:hypothetical protein